MRIAFYAPLKAPDHPVPSGDREIARALIEALTLAGHDVALASRLRTFDRQGEPMRQRRLQAIGQRVADRLVQRFRRAERPDLWFTYHLHHKAPDGVGPRVCRALDLPYVVAEASIAPRQREGAWATGFAQARSAICGADLVVFLNPTDVAQVRNARTPDAASAMLAPFIDVARFAGPRVPRRDAGTRLRLATVAMMRDGAKLASYRMLAAALMRLPDLDFELSIVGDGPARADVEAAFAPLVQPVTFLGARDKPDVAAILRGADIFVWPAIDEAIGVVFLEAQACGRPVVGADTPGVASVVANGRTGLLAIAGDPSAFANAVRTLAVDAALREHMRAEAPAHVLQRHDLPVAARALDAMLRGTVERHRAAHPIGLG
jgi:glycosyltransferase involved in cell wall biosynthesis